ncbi:MAG: division/cell wall cluster transcriptional repressor MraZ [Candidatus Andersenbacteria bacterium]
MFIGEYSHTIDEKGRVNMPSKFRRDLVEGVVITRGLDHCLFVYTRAQWEQMAEKLAALPVTQKKSRAFARLMLAGAWDTQLDGQGRVMLPEYLRKYASLGKHVTVTGLYSRIEIWNEDAWNEYKAETEAESDNIAEAMSDLGI